MRPSIAREIIRKKATLKPSSSSTTPSVVAPAPAPAPMPIRKSKSSPAIKSAPASPQNIPLETKPMSNSNHDMSPTVLSKASSDVSQSGSISEQMKDSNLSGDAYLTHYFDTIMGNLEVLTGSEVIKNLTNLYNDITEHRGYTSILKQIDIGIKSIKNLDVLKKSEVDGIRKKMKFWKKKLNL